MAKISIAPKTPIIGVLSFTRFLPFTSMTEEMANKERNNPTRLDEHMKVHDMIRATIEDALDKDGDQSHPLETNCHDEDLPIKGHYCL